MSFCRDHNVKPESDSLTFACHPAGKKTAGQEKFSKATQFMAHHWNTIKWRLLSLCHETVMTHGQMLVEPTEHDSQRLPLVNTSPLGKCMAICSWSTLPSENMWLKHTISIRERWRPATCEDAPAEESLCFWVRQHKQECNNNRVSGFQWTHSGLSTEILGREFRP